MNRLSLPSASLLAAAALSEGCAYQNLSNLEQLERSIMIGRFDSQPAELLEDSKACAEQLFETRKNYRFSIMETVDQHDRDLPPYPGNRYAHLTHLSKFSSPVTATVSDFYESPNDWQLELIDKDAHYQLDFYENSDHENITLKARLNHSFDPVLMYIWQSFAHYEEQNYDPQMENAFLFYDDHLIAARSVEYVDRQYFYDPTTGKSHVSISSYEDLPVPGTEIKKEMAYDLRPYIPPETSLVDGVLDIRPPDVEKGSELPHVFNEESLGILNDRALRWLHKFNEACLDEIKDLEKSVPQ